MSEFRRRLMMMQWENTPIVFEDPEVKRICVENFGGENGITNRVYGTVGIKGIAGEITPEQAKGVINMGTLFKGNGSITSFIELSLFRNIKQLPSFQNCTSLKRVSIPENLHASNSGVYFGFLNTPIEDVYIESFPLYIGKEYQHVGEPFAANNGSYNTRLIVNGVLLAGEIHINSLYVSGLRGYGNMSSVIYRYPGVHRSISAPSLTHVRVEEGAFINPQENNWFSSCRNLISVDLPSNTNLIGISPFIYCPNLTNLIVRATRPPSWVRNDGFSGYLGRPKFVFVPNESVDAYSNDPVWGLYADRIKPLSNLEL